MDSEEKKIINKSYPYSEKYLKNRIFHTLY